MALMVPGCKDDDCGACFTPPMPFAFEIVDKQTGENLFTNGKYNSNQIKMLDSEDRQIAYTFINENNVNLIQVNSIGWKTEIINYTLSIGTEDLFTLHVNAERLSENCCSYTRYNEVLIEYSDYEYIANTGIYKIFVE